MWSTIDRFSRPRLTRHVFGQARCLNTRARGLLEQRTSASGDGRVLVETLVASAVCWQLVRRGLAAPRRRLLRRHLKRESGVVDLLAAPPPGALAALRRQVSGPRQGRALKRLQRLLREPTLGPRRRRTLTWLLATEATWLDELGQAPAPTETDLRAALARLYRKARRASASRPGSARSRRLLQRLVLGEELILAAPGHNPQMPGIRKRRRLLGLLDEDAWLKGLADSPAVAAGKPRDRQRIDKLVRRRRRELIAEFDRAAASAFPEAAARYRHRLPWRMFIALAAAARDAGSGEGASDHADTPEGTAALPNTAVANTAVANTEEPRERNDE